jgi:hypothetical protein
MKIDFAKIFLVLFFSFSAQLFSQNAPETVRIDAPALVAVDSPFQISIVHNFEGDISDESYFELFVPENINLSNVYLRDGLNEDSLSFEENGSSFIVKFLTDNSKIDFYSPIQIVFEFAGNAKEAEEIEISFVSSGNFSEWTETIPIDFYFISEKAGDAAEFNQGSELIIQPDGEFESENFTVEFWGKFESGIDKFFSVVNKLSSDTLFYVDNNSLNILACQMFDAETLCERFLSPGNWYHFVLEILQSENELNFYVNGEKVIYKNLYERFDFSDLYFVISNFEDKKSFYIDEIHVWANNETIAETLEKNSSYEIGGEKGAKKILNLDFNNEKELSNPLENFSVSANNLKIKESDAPLFTRAPSIDVESFSGYNLISWTSKDEENVSEFVVEKSFAEGGYEEIYFKEATGEDGEYYYSDYREADEGVVYYRVKQINKDGSVVYSPSVKIGLRELKEFEIVQNFPNPFNPSTNISVNILVAGEYRIRVYNVTGKVVTELENGFLFTGTHEYTFNGAGLTSGIYFFEIKSQTSVRAIKMIMTK